MRFRFVVAAVAAMLAVAPSFAAADTLEPSQWPEALRLGSAPNAVRIGGTDRYDTALAMSFALRGIAGFPFDTPDRTAGWWGAATCPASVIIVAGDNPADALASAPLSDPTNGSNEPRLQRVASSDPFFDPIGELDRIDTEAAPIIVTAPARAGAQGLSESARLAVSDLAAGGCTSAREAIIVGGQAAVPVEVEGELVSLGYREVFRVAGVDRFDTAARIAAALGTEPAPAGASCVDPFGTNGSTEMGFYGNAVIEYRAGLNQCQVLGRTVVLAEGSAGADALAAGWWTSFWQVPVLLVGADGELPPATRSALQSMAIDTIVVLGGTGRIPESTVDEAKALAGAVVGRFAGDDRYKTAVVMAQVFGGWYPTGEADDFHGDTVCLAASEGGADGRGWPDALAAGPWCGRANGAVGALSAPSRTVSPVEESSGSVEPGRRSHDAVPVLLVRPGASSVSSAVVELLKSSFAPDGRWCGPAVAPGCRTPGFAVAFGGSATVSDLALAQASSLLSGDPDAPVPTDPALAEAFRTALDLTPVYAAAGAGGAEGACFDRAAIAGARWLALYDDDDLRTFSSSVDLITAHLYEIADGEVATPPLCVRSPAEGDGDTAVVAVGPWGAATVPLVLRYGPDRTIEMSRVMRHARPRSTEGPPGTSGGGDETTIWRFNDRSAPLEVRDRDVTFGVARARASIFLARGGDAGPARFVAEIDLAGGPSFTGTATGEAVLEGDRWELAGRFRLPGASGGFRGTLFTQGTDDNGDDVLTWRVDASYP